MLRPDIARVLAVSMSHKPTTSPDVSSPPGVPLKKLPRASQVRMDDEDWKDLDEIARFHEETFRLQGAKQDVSRNDVIVAFLAWARGAFWDDKGGRPKNEKEFQEKVKQHVARLAKKRDASE